MSNGNNCIVSRAWYLLITIVIALGIGIISTWSVNRSVHNTTETLVSQDYAFQLKVLELRYHIVQVQQWLTDISATRGLDGLDDGYAEAQTHADLVIKLIDEASALDSGNDGFYQDMRHTFDRYYATGKKMAQLYVEQGPAGGNPFMNTFDEAAGSMSESLYTVMKRAAKGASTRLGEIQQTSSTATVVNLVISLTVMVMLVGGLLYLINLLKPLTQIREATVRLAANDLTFDIKPTRGKHEVAILSTSFVQMKDNLKHAISEISDVANTVNHTTQEMSKVADETHQGVSSQNQQIEQIATAINQMASTVLEISHSTAAAAESANQANDAVTKGGQVVEEAVAATRDLAQRVSHGASMVGRVQNESESIDKVLVVIRGIAEQTNLLALNAAIEAARAGEQGRGFAVVADEVRALASKTQDSTKEIQNMIERLQAGSAEAADVMNHSHEQADRTAQLASDAGHSLSEIRKSVSLINEMSLQIATAAEQQGATANEINRNIEGIRQVSEQTASAAQKTNHASENLNSQAVTLHQFVARFKV
jgi:methyl-accepting chemotaxis protein